MSHSELATSYAALILADDEVEVTVSRSTVLLLTPPLANSVPKPDKLQTLIKAANVEDVESIWTTLFAKVGINTSKTVGHRHCREQRLIGSRLLKGRMSRTCY